MRLIKKNKPDIEAVTLDVSKLCQKLPKILCKGSNDSKVKVIEHDLSLPLPELDCFEATISSFAICYLKHERKKVLYEEIYDILNPIGVFCNLEHVA